MLGFGIVQIGLSLKSHHPSESKRLLSCRRRCGYLCKRDFDPYHRLNFDVRKEEKTMPAVLFPLENLPQEEKEGYKIENNREIQYHLCRSHMAIPAEKFVGSGRDHHSTMSVKDICGLKVEENRQQRIVSCLMGDFSPYSLKLCV